MSSPDIDRVLNVLMHESAQARDDERYMSTQFATIITVALALIVAMATLFYQTCPDGYCPNTEPKLTPVPIWLYVGTPILPIILITYVVLLASAQGLRSYYVRTIEVRIHQLTKQYHSDLPIPSWEHLQLDVTGQTRARGFAGLSWGIIYVNISLLIIGCIYLVTSKIPVIRYRIFALVVDISLLVIPSAMSVVSMTR